MSEDMEQDINSEDQSNVEGTALAEENTSSSDIELPELDDNSLSAGEADETGFAANNEPLDNSDEKSAVDLEAVFDVPVTISAILGKTDMEVSALLRLTRGAIIELDRKVGEAIDIYVNDRLVARGEVVLVEEQLGVTMTEIIQAD